MTKHNMTNREYFAWRAAESQRRPCDKCDGPNPDWRERNYCPACREEYRNRLRGDHEYRPVGS